MDNLKKFLVVAKKYHFWIICGTVLLTVIVCWWLATAGLAGQFQQRKTKLEGDFKNVIIAQNHPNQRVLDKIQKQHEELKAGVFTAWRELYNEQKMKNPFPKVLGDDFKQQFENVMNRPKMELEPKYRERYQNFIMLHLPDLLKDIDVRRPPEEKQDEADGKDRATGNRATGARQPGGGRARAAAPGMEMGMGGGRAGGNAANEEWIGTVDWNDANYRALEQRFEWRERPSTLAVLLAQEDLWVIEALLRIIKNTNEGATSYSTASVKQIEALQIGRDAANAWKTAENLVFRAGAGGMGGGMMGMEGGPMGGGMMGGMDGGMGGGMGGGMMGMEGPGGPGMGMGGAGGAGDEQARRQLFEGRYVDDKGKPLPYDPEFPYAKHPYAEFKMMPIRMSLTMDQRRLPKLLAECANSNMPIQVKRVRIMKTQGGSLDLGAAATGGGRGGMMGGPMEMGSRPRSGSGIQPMGGKDEGAPNDIPVEIHGVIYIYNPPDIERLGTGTASAEKPADAAASGGQVTPPQTAPVVPPAGLPKP